MTDLEGRHYAVTGGARGIGYFAVEQLAARGAAVTLLARSASRAETAMDAVRRQVPTAVLDSAPFDLASLASALTPLAGTFDGIALNAGLTSPTKGRELTADGFEYTVGANYLGHFALMSHALRSLTPDARVVAMGSMSTRLAKADLADLMQEHGSFSSSKAYAYSKHAMQSFGFELDRRLRAVGSGIQSLVAHPGFALDAQAPRRAAINDLSSGARFAQNLLRPMTQGKHRGAAILVAALTDASIPGGSYLAPSGGLKGTPALHHPVAQSHDPAFGAELWRLSEQWAGVKFDV